MARRRRSFLSRFRMITRNLRNFLPALIGLLVLGSVGYFSIAGISYSWLPVALDDDLDQVLLGENSEGASAGDAIEQAARIESAAISAAKNWISTVVPPIKSPAEIAIGTFNVQRFGASQLQSPNVMKSLVEISQEFDVLAIQEITHKNGRLLNTFVEILNMVPGNHFDYLISPLLGKKEPGSYKEQFGFLYDKNRIRLRNEDLPGFVVSEKKFATKFDRLPVVTRFQVSSEVNQSPFTFSLVNLHTVPKRVAVELANLNDVYLDVKTILADEDDVILLGDFNASFQVIHKALSISKLPIRTAITDQSTNLKKTASYDNIVFDEQKTSEFRSAMVIDFTPICQKNGVDPDKVSDHFPVKATFLSKEIRSIPKIASQKRLP
ncbi:MAG: endonuclease/exonuclease/phosphatase family protein [Pirellulaceae bacterium]|nr:endonuclease/exonuclease/phosphatase family protein [Pirellulaceae bacterium]